LPVVAVDLGGTKIVAALIDAGGTIVDRERVETMANQGPEAVIDRMLGAIDVVLDRNRVATHGIGGICVGAPGPVDMARGILSTPPNLPGWYTVPLRAIVHDHYGLDSYLINDAKAAALGEHRFGAGQGIANMIYITVSTGIGGGIIANGRLYVGRSGGAGEVGHMTIDVNGPRCACGNTGCWEALASGTAMAKEAIRRLASGEKSSLTEMVGDGTHQVTPVEIAEAARNGDGLALSVVGWTARYLGVGLANLVNIFNPEMIIVGGGLSKIGDLLLQPAVKVVGERAFKLLSEAVSIVPSPLGDDAGVLGAAAFALKKGEL
jgi:glucokinase